MTWQSFLSCFRIMRLKTQLGALVFGNTWCLEKYLLLSLKSTFMTQNLVIRGSPAQLDGWIEWRIHFDLWLLAYKDTNRDLQAYGFCVIIIKISVVSLGRFSFPENIRRLRNERHVRMCQGRSIRFISFYFEPLCHCCWVAFLGSALFPAAIGSQVKVAFLGKQVLLYYCC